MIYDLDPAANNTDYAIAWQAESVPEPSTWLLVVLGVAAALFIHLRVQRSRISSL